jgi:hypothetical protein
LSQGTLFFRGAAWKIAKNSSKDLGRMTPERAAAAPKNF